MSELAIKRALNENTRKQGILIDRGAPCMGNNLAVEVRYALGSRKR